MQCSTMHSAPGRPDAPERATATDEAETEIALTIDSGTDPVARTGGVAGTTGTTTTEEAVGTTEPITREESMIRATATRIRTRNPAS